MSDPPAVGLENPTDPITNGPTDNSPGETGVNGVAIKTLDNDTKDDEHIQSDDTGDKEKDKTEKPTRSSTRKTQLTPKGKEFQLNNHIAFMKSNKKRLVKQAALINTLLTGSNRDMVTNELTPSRRHTTNLVKTMPVPVVSWVK